MELVRLSASLLPSTGVPRERFTPAAVTGRKTHLFKSWALPNHQPKSRSSGLAEENPKPVSLRMRARSKFLNPEWLPVRGLEFLTKARFIGLALWLQLAVPTLALDWETNSTYRSAALSPGPGHNAGFLFLRPDQTGVVFTNL